MKPRKFIIAFISIQILIVIIVAVFKQKFFLLNQQKKLENFQTESYVVKEVTTTIEDVNYGNLMVGYHLWEVIEFTVHDHSHIYYRDSVAGDVSDILLKSVLLQLKESRQKIKILYRIRKKEWFSVDDGELRAVLSIRTIDGNILWKDNNEKVRMSIESTKGLMPAEQGE